MRGSLAAALAFKGRALANCRAEPCLIVHLPGSKTRSITSRTATGVCGQLHDCRCKDQASPLTQSSSSVGSPSRFSSLPAGLAICPRAAAQRVTKRRKTLVQVEPQLPGRASIARSSLNCQVGPQLPGRASTGCSPKMQNGRIRSSRIRPFMSSSQSERYYHSPPPPPPPPPLSRRGPRKPPRPPPPPPPPPPP